MPLKQVRDRAFHVQELGSGPGGADPLVAMVHGLALGTLASWYFTVAPRLARRRRVLLYDQRGHGLSQRAPEGYDLATLAADLAAVLEAAGVTQPVDLVGHSHGGAVVLRFALDHPDRVRRLVLVEAPLPPFDRDEIREILEADPEAVLASLPDHLDPDFLGGSKRWARRMGVAVRFREETTMPADLAAEPAFPDAHLSGLRRPVLLVYGATSKFSAIGEALAARLPQAGLVLLPGGHLLHLEATVELTRTIEEFLDG